MKLKGAHDFDTTPEVLWGKLMDPEVLAKVTPGVSRLEKVEEDQYKAIADVKLGPVKGSFKGDLAVLDKQEPKSFNLSIKQTSKIGNVAAEVNIQLDSNEDGSTQMAFDGNAKLSGLLARTGQRVLSGVANTLTKQFFKAMEEELMEGTTT